MKGEKERLVELSQGTYVERDVWNVVEKIRHYDSNLRIKYLGRNDSYTDAPYALFEQCPDGIERLIFTIWELDDRVLERLRNADTQRQNVLSNMDVSNAEIKASLDRRYKEKALEKHDIAEHVFKSPKGKYSYTNDDGNLVVVDDDPTKRARTVIESRRNKT